jgi:serine/threonine-protein kinase RsbW
MGAKNSKTLILQSTEKQIRRLKPFLEDLRKWFDFDEERFTEIRLALNEAVTNAIIHGNKNDASKKVYISASRNEKGLIISVKDEGEGFNVNNIPDPTEKDNLLKPSGRGIFLIKQQADEVSFTQKATITMQFYLE